MSDKTVQNSDQRDFWTDEAGPIWVDQRAAMDALLAPILDSTLARAELQLGQSVLDIGCGAGTSTLAIAEQIGETGHVTGIDISRTLLDEALTRGLGKSNVAFLDADAQTHPLATGSADRIASRFGVMFFGDSQAAFRNMSNALRDDGTMSFSAWGAIADNPFFTLPAQIARQILGPVPKSDPDAPGPFAFRDPDVINNLLSSAGLSVEINTVHEPLLWAETPRDRARTMCMIGPAHIAINHHEADAAMKETLLDALSDALSIYESETGLTIPAQINYVTARKAT